MSEPATPSPRASSSLWHFLLDDASWDAYWTDLAPLQVPASPATIPAFSEIPGILQTSALLEGRLPPIPPDQLIDFSDALDSETARATLLSRACERAAGETDPAALEVWTAALTAELTAEPHWRGLPYAPRLSACSDVASPLALFTPEWDELSGGLALPTLSVERVHYLSSFDLPFQDGLDAWAVAAASAHSLRVRAVAARYVRSRSLATAGEGDMALWRAAVLALVDGTRSSEVLRQLLPAAASFTDAPAADREAFQAALVDVVRSPDTRPAHATAVCAAYELTTDDPSAWTSFVTAVRDAPLGAQARILLEDPARCE